MAMLESEDVPETSQMLEKDKAFYDHYGAAPVVSWCIPSTDMEEALKPLIQDSHKVFIYKKGKEADALLKASNYCESIY